MFKKYLAIIIFTIFSLSIFTSVVLAQTPPKPLQDLGNPSGDFSRTNDQQKEDAADQGIKLNEDKGNPNSCSFGLGVLKQLVPGTSGTMMGSIGNCAISLISSITYYVFYTVSGFFTYTAGQTGRLMDYVLFVTVVNFTENFTEIPSQNVSIENGGLIYYAWSLVRDILNAGVFFVIIYHAVMAMFNGFADIKKKFIALLMFVVLVNFSLLFVKLVADVSNIAILQMYEIAVKPVGTSTYEDFKKSRLPNSPNSLSEYVINSTKTFSTVSQTRSEAEVKAAMNSMSQTALYQFGLTVVYLYMTFLFLYISAILLTRAATFIVIMVVSPLLVAGQFFSGFEKELQKVKDELFEEALQGPGIIFFLLLSSLIGYGLFNLDSTISGSVLNQAGSEPTVISSNLGMFLRVAFFAIFNFYAFKFIRDLTTRGNNFSEKLFGAGLGLAFGATAFGARKLIGGAANSLLNNSRIGGNLADIASDPNAGRFKRGLASGLLSTANLARNSTFDIRSGMSAMQKTVLGGKIITGLKTGIPMDVNFGKGSDDTAAKTQKKKDEAENKRRNSYREMVESAGQNSWTVNDGQLINEGLIKAEYNGKETDIRDLKAMSKALSDSNFEFKNNIRSRTTSGRGEDQVDLDGVKMSANDWQNLIDNDQQSKEKRRSIEERTNGLDDESNLYINGQSKKVKDWKKEMEDLENESIKKALEKANEKLSDGSKRTSIVEKYLKNKKGSREDGVNNLQGQGKITYMSELPNRALRAAVRKITGEQRDGGDFRADAAAKKRYEQSTKPDTQAKSLTASMFNQAFTIADTVNNLATIMDMNAIQKDINTINRFQEGGAKYVKTINGKVEPMPKSERDDLMKAFRGISNEMMGQMRYASIPQRERMRKANEQIDKLEERIVKIDDAAKTKDKKEGDDKKGEKKEEKK